MRLNELKPAVGSRSSARRVGRGNASGHGKTCGRGHKGQRSRSGGFHKIGFEGGQMPLQRRLPKRGFSSRKSRSRAEVRLDELNTLPGEVVTLRTLIGASIVSAATRYVKVINSGKLEKPIRLQGIGTSSGARAAIESVGGKVEG